MKTLKNLFISIFSLIIAVCLIFYLSFLYVFPAVLNSSANIHKIENLILEKTGFKIVTDNFKFYSTPKLKLRLGADKIDIYSDNKNKALQISKINSNVDLKNLEMHDINIENVEINGEELKKFNRKSSNKKFNIDVNKIPEITIKNGTYSSEDLQISLNDFHFTDNIGKFHAEIAAPFLKNKLIIGNQGVLRVSENSLFADNFNILFGKNSLHLNGKIIDNDKNHNFTVKGENLPVEDIEKSLLFYQKSQDPTKKFIENFKNYSGNLDVDLVLRNKEIFGKCIAKNLKANAVWFDIPIIFPKAVFDFKGKTITSVAQGTLGGEKVVHTLDVINLGSPDKEVTGSAVTTFTQNFEYIPNLSVLNSADAKIVYNIKNQKINVQYLLNLKENSDLIYKNAYLGLRDKQRKFEVKTLKDGNNLYVKDYQYKVKYDDGEKTIISGDGLFFRKDGHFNPIFLTGSTNGYAPASVTGSFRQYIEGGELNGDLKYDFTNEKLTGNFDVRNTHFKDFYVNSAKIIANNDVKIQANGLYHGELFTCDASVKNDFSDKIIVNDLDLFLDKFTIKRGTKSNKVKNLDISSKVKKADIDINNWKIKVNQIKKDKIALKDINLVGNLKNNLFNFSMPELSFAEGTLSAIGKYNFNDDSSKIDFSAKNINSNIAADMVFDLTDQVEGIADATLNVETFDKLNDVKAKAWFRVKEGFLPELGSTNFMVKNSKFKISDIINIDFTKRNALKSDIQGTFDLDNYKIKNTNITSQQKFLSLLITGDYDIKEHYADANIYGKYDKQAPKGIKILFVPLNWIIKAVSRQESTMEIYKTELDKIPSIDTSLKNEQYFRVHLLGKLKNGKVNVELKRIK